ncbi:MAG: SEC-C domain-containing protein [Planctomycetes bacterium]|jgi:hypothetical protein|nr:SEC-C domain-containing protein [Planctomycetota bacterium]
MESSGAKTAPHKERVDAMNNESSPLPWDELRRTEGDIPWAAMRTFAAALPTDPTLVDELFDAYNVTFDALSGPVDNADLCVPAIFALAAPQLDDEQRRRIGSFLIDRLVAAGREDADVAMEVLTAAAGTLGPAVVPAVLDAIAREPDTRGAWLFLWSLTKLAARSEDQDLRSRVIQVCVQLLEKADRGEVDQDDAGHAAWTLALLGAAEYTSLLQRVQEKAQGVFWGDEYEEAVKWMRGERDFTPPHELWEEPVEQWLTPRWGEGEEWPDVEEEHDEEEENPHEAYAQLIARTFVTSPVAAGLPPDLLGQAHLVAHDLVSLSLRFLGKQPREWDEAVLRELLLNLVPRDTPADRQQLQKIIPITEAFLYWLGSEGLLADAQELAAAVRSWSDQLVAAGLDRKNWGPVKTFLMTAQEAGPGALTEEHLRAVFTAQIEAAAQALAELPEVVEPAPAAPEEPPIPIRERSSQPGRNDPCYCGSGRKYKKCHGRPEAQQSSNL